MLNATWREQTWSALDQPWDVIVIGGGITGAGIFNMAAQKGLKVLLLEANDFAFGTSSRSSKLVHGGIRYLKTASTMSSKNPSKSANDCCANPMAWLIRWPSSSRLMKTNAHETKMMKLGVIIYDLMAPKWQHSTSISAKPKSPACLERSNPDWRCQV
jgi:glycerol-3-phosphate dehydrogenase